MNRLDSFVHGFPKKLATDVEYACAWIQKHAHTRHDVFQEYSEWKLRNGETIQIPYRMYASDILFPTSWNEIQVMIYHCIYTRNDNGFIREKHVKALIENEPPEWVYPYILKVCNGNIRACLSKFIHKRLYKMEIILFVESKNFCL